MINIFGSRKDQPERPDMNDYQRGMYRDLMMLCEHNETFYFKDHVADGIEYRVFSYRMGSYTEFCLPSALECRGVMFRMQGELCMELVSLPFPKFFNLYENPMTMNPDWFNVVRFEEKADGSLISTYMHDGDIRVKSKTSLTSIMANDANDFINRPENHKFRKALKYFAEHGYTTIMEWCDPKPESRIVLSYEYAHLRVFGMRCNATGEIVNYWEDRCFDHAGFDSEDAFDHAMELVKASVDHYTTDDPKGFATATTEEKGIEGYIMVMKDNSRIKIKTQWYVTQHRLKDTVTNASALFVAVITGSSDDLKSIFHDNPGAVEIIEEMEEYAFARYKNFVKAVDLFYQENKHLSRKEYAIKAKEEVEPWMFGSVMMLYTGKEVDHVKVMTGKTKSVKLHVNEFKGQTLKEAEE